MKEPRSGITNILGKGTRVDGKLKVEGSIHIDGAVEGNVNVTELLIIGKTGKVQGEIHTKDCFCGGKIDGNLYSEGRVEFKSGAMLKGDLKCKQLIIEENVMFDGSCKMSDKVMEVIKK